MKIKILKLGESAREIQVQEGATVEHAIQASGFSREHTTVTLNGYPTFDTSPVKDGDIIAMNPNIICIYTLKTCKKSVKRHAGGVKNS
jgi:putative ubiquitin-RnfH superfamily antitoxin RatB of RatAB toxin-antitoxin module